MTLTVTDTSGEADSITVRVLVTNLDDQGSRQPPTGGGGVGGGDPVHAPGAPTFNDGSRTVRSVPENSPAGTNVGAAVEATDPDERTLTYTLSGTDADLFDIDTSTGQLLTKAALDFETNNSYSVTVDVRDSKDAEGEPDQRRDDSIGVTVLVTNQNDPGVVTPSAPTPRVGESFTVALVDRNHNNTTSQQGADQSLHSRQAAARLGH